ncbi:gamma-butyrobetaine dioxygenase [Ciona intestinalis]
MQNCLIKQDGGICDVVWKDGHESSYHSTWLRYNCQCKKCFREFSGTYTIDILSLPEVLSVTKAEVHNEGKALKTWFQGESPHMTEHDADWLRSQCYCDNCLDCDIIKRDVINSQKCAGKLPTVDYNTIDKDEERFKFNVLKQVVDSGICLIQNVPITPGQVLKVASMFGPIYSTLYGNIFDVLDRKAENAAYTNLLLPFHQDQPQYESMPGVQLLHALRFDSSVTGGESQILDLFRAAETFRRENPKYFQTLCEVPCKFETMDKKRSHPVFQEHQKPHFVVDYFGKLVAVNWHPGIAVATRVRFDDVPRYYEAYRGFLKLLERKEGMFEFRLKTGDLIIFNNRRVAHARSAFENNGGVRHLQGTYINLDDLKSNYMTLAIKLGENVTPPKVGNGSSF